MYDVCLLLYEEHYYALFAVGMVWEVVLLHGIRIGIQRQELAQVLIRLRLYHV